MSLASNFVGMFRSVPGFRKSRQEAPPMDEDTRRATFEVSEKGSQFALLAARPDFQAYAAEVDKLLDEYSEALSGDDDKAFVGARAAVKALRRVKNIVPDCIAEGKAADKLLAEHSGTKRKAAEE